MNGKVAFFATGLVTLLLALAASAALGQNAPFKILHTFGGASDGVGPSSGVILDKRGNLYGETLGGGNMSCGNGCGTVYELSPQKDGTWSEKILYNFGDGGTGDGLYPNGGLAMDATGNLYGVTRFGGANDGGTAFELSPGVNWTETTLHSFCTPPDDADGCEPGFAPLLDSHGNLYGTTQQTAYELSPGPSGWTDTVLYTFCSQPNCTDGRLPGALVRDAAGNLYGPAYEGGASNDGLIFMLRPQSGGGQWRYEVLYNFKGGGDGVYPDAVVLHGKNLYGLTDQGGGSRQCTLGCGIVFDLAANPAGGAPVETILHRFASSAQGLFPQGAVVVDRAGNLYGAASSGGTGCGGGCGAVFEMTPGSGGTWQYQVLHDFTGQDGELPQYGVITDGRGHLYGTTLGGGAPYYGGVVFEISVPTEATK